MTRVLTLEAEYGCYPIWEVLTPPDGDGVRNINVAELGLSQSLVKHLLDWASEFDSTLDHDYPPDSGFPTNEALRRFNIIGSTLAESLQRELGTGVIVKHVPYKG